jgi:Tfp pilus assembly protein PilF
VAASANAPSRSPGVLSPRLLLGLGLLLTALVYVSVWRFDFVYDDHPQVQNNPTIRDWSHLRGYFTAQLWSNTGRDQASNYYRPVFLLWLRVQYRIFGLQPAYWHAASLMLHLLATWLAYLAALSLLTLSGHAGDNRTLAAITALLFGLHPAHVEAVAWVSAASELLLTIFFLAAFVAYAKARVGSQRTAWTGASLACFALALLAKETAATFLLVVVACEMVLSGGVVAARITRALRASFPWIATVAVYLMVRQAVLGELGHQQGAMSAATILKSVPALLWFYCRHLLWPHPLAEFYDVYPVESARSVAFLLPVGGIVIIAAALWLVVRRSRTGTIAALWMPITLLPVLDIAALRADAFVADRYLYLPSFGFCVLAAMFLVWVGESVSARTAIPIAVGAVALLMAAASARQLVPWENDLLLFANAVKVAPQNAYAKSCLASELMLRGQNQRALPLLQESYARDPNAWMTAFNLAYLYYEMGNLAKAEQFFQRAIGIDAHNLNQYYYLGLTQKREGKLADAEQSLRKTAELWPKAPYLHTMLGDVLEQEGKYDEALVEYERDLGSENPAPARAGIARIEARRADAAKPTHVKLPR